MSFGGPTPSHGGQWQRYLNDGEDLVSHCDFSPGPWWGFNGIRTLLLTSERLVVVSQSSMGIRRPPSFRLDEVDCVRWRRRRAWSIALGAVAVVLKVHLSNRARTFASKYEFAEEFSESLAHAVARHGV